MTGGRTQSRFMLQDTKGDCFNCEKANLRPADINIAGKLKSEVYTIHMRGLRCPNCGYETIEGADTPQFRRLLAEAYQRAHGLLTVSELIARRKRLGMSQDAFTKHTGLSPATIKRAEAGKILERSSDQLIRQKTAPNLHDTINDALLLREKTPQSFKMESATFV